MTNSADTPSEDLKRIPGLFRRWELPRIFEANRDYHIEDAGAHADGTPLVALYSSDPLMKHTPMPAVLPDRPVTEIEFCAWVAQALPGERLQYHRGFLVLDTFPLFSRLGDKEREALRKLADRSFWAAEQGLVHLVQKRVGPDCFAYIAVARPKPKSASISLSELLLEGEAA